MFVGLYTATLTGADDEYAVRLAVDDGLGTVFEDCEWTPELPHIVNYGPVDSYCSAGSGSLSRCLTVPVYGGSTEAVVVDLYGLAPMTESFAVDALPDKEQCRVESRCKIVYSGCRG